MGQSFYDLLKDAAFAGGGGGSPAPAPVLIEKSVTENGTYTASDDEADGYSSVSVDVPNTYAAGDEGKVVQNGALVSQTSTSVSQNGTINTTTNNSVAVNVPNTYTASDEGKVVSNGSLVAQGSDIVTENGTVDTTLISSLLVNVAGSGASALKLISDQNIIVNDCYIFEGEQYIYIFGYVQQEKSSLASLIIPQEFNINIIGAKVKHVWHSISSSDELNNFNSFTFDAELRKITFRSTSNPTSSYTTKYMFIVTFEKNSV